jgi:hypothetical protein
MESMTVKDRVQEFWMDLRTHGLRNFRLELPLPGRRVLDVARLPGQRMRPSTLRELGARHLWMGAWEVVLYGPARGAELNSAS